MPETILEDFASFINIPELQTIKFGPKTEEAAAIKLSLRISVSNDGNN